jgi:DNA-binding HxlR family transcriptional regulator
LVIDALDGAQSVRWSHLRHEIGGISQKMMTKTLRQLERDGLVTRLHGRFSYMWYQADDVHLRER